MLRIISLILALVSVTASGWVSTCEKYQPENQSNNSIHSAVQDSVQSGLMLAANDISLSNEANTKVTNEVGVVQNGPEEELMSISAGQSLYLEKEKYPVKEKEDEKPITRIEDSQTQNKPAIAATHPVTSEKVADDKHVTVTDLPKPTPKPLVSENTGKDGELQVLEFVLAKEMEGREPKNVTDSFEKGTERAVAFARVSSPIQTNIMFVWLKDNKEYTRYTTPVHAAKTWRTFSSIKLRPGKWKVQLVKDDKVLAEREFIVN